LAGVKGGDHFPVLEHPAGDSKRHDETSTTIAKMNFG
jgi:hypothetical protein